MELILFLVLGGALILVFLYTLLFQHPNRSEEREPVAELVRILALPGLQFKAAAHVLDASDYRALRASFLNKLARQLRRDRRQIALDWLKQLQSEVTVLWRFRRLAAQHDTSATAGEEVKVMASVLAVQLYLSFLRGLVCVAGPWPFAGLLRGARVGVETISGSCAELLGRVPTTKWREIERAWTAELAAHAIS